MAKEFLPELYDPENGEILMVVLRITSMGSADYLYVYLWGHLSGSDHLGFFLRDCTPVLSFWEFPGGEEFW